MKTTTKQDMLLSNIFMNEFSMDWSAFIDAIQTIFNPEDIFSDDKLSRWAEEHSWIWIRK